MNKIVFVGIKKRERDIRPSPIFIDALALYSALFYRNILWSLSNAIW